MNPLDPSSFDPSFFDPSFYQHISPKKPEAAGTTAAAQPSWPAAPRTEPSSALKEACAVLNDCARPSTFSVLKRKLPPQKATLGNPRQTARPKRTIFANLKGRFGKDKVKQRTLNQTSMTELDSHRGFIIVADRRGKPLHAFERTALGGWQGFSIRGGVWSAHPPNVTPNTLVAKMYGGKKFKVQTYFIEGLSPSNADADADLDVDDVQTSTRPASIVEVDDTADAEVPGTAHRARARYA